MKLIEPRLFIITGISGSGKTTIARQLLRRGEVAFDSKLNPGLYQFVDIEGSVTSSIKLHDENWRAAYKWSLNEVALESLLQRYGKAERVFLCGRANLFRYWDKADQVFLLKVDRSTLQKRLNSESRDNLFGKDKVTQSKLLSELDTIQNKIAEKGAIIIDARLPVEEVIDEILSRVSQ